MYGFLYFGEPGILINPTDIIAAQLDETEGGEEFVTVDMRRPNTFYTIHVDHEVFLEALSNAYQAPNSGGGLMDC